MQHTGAIREEQTEEKVVCSIQLLLEEANQKESSMQYTIAVEKSKLRKK